MKTCEDCGCSVYNGHCTNCHEDVYIAEQHYEQGSWGECSDAFKNEVRYQLDNPQN